MIKITAGKKFKQKKRVRILGKRSVALCIASMALLSAGCSTEVKKEDRMDNRMMSEKEINKLLLFASEKGDVEGVKWAINHGAYIDFRNGEGKTALMCAALNGHKEIVKYLVEHHANINMKDHFQRDARLFAIIKGYYDIARIIRRDL